MCSSTVQSPIGPDKHQAPQGLKDQKAFTYTEPEEMMKTRCEVEQRAFTPTSRGKKKKNKAEPKCGRAKINKERN